MKQPETYKELDKLIGQIFWTFGFYIGPYSYKFKNINPPTRSSFRERGKIWI